MYLMCSRQQIVNSEPVAINKITNHSTLTGQPNQPRLSTLCISLIWPLFRRRLQTVSHRTNVHGFRHGEHVGGVPHQNDDITDTNRWPGRQDHAEERSFPQRYDGEAESQLLQQHPEQVSTMGMQLWTDPTIATASLACHYYLLTHPHMCCYIQSLPVLNTRMHTKAWTLRNETSFGLWYVLAWTCQHYAHTHELLSCVVVSVPGYSINVHLFWKCGPATVLCFVCL